MASPVVSVRVAAEPGDLAGIGEVDLSYSTDRVYLVRRTELSFSLEELNVDPPVLKTYPQLPRSRVTLDRSPCQFPHRRVEFAAVSRSAMSAESNCSHDDDGLHPGRTPAPTFRVCVQPRVARSS